jgi:hypothetical protein
MYSGHPKRHGAFQRRSEEGLESVTSSLLFMDIDNFHIDERLSFEILAQCKPWVKDGDPFYIGRFSSKSQLLR